jgi:hypothetical protein
MTCTTLKDLADSLSIDVNLYKAIAGGFSVEPERASHLSRALLAGETSVATEHAVYSGCNTTSCGCGGSI